MKLFVSICAMLSYAQLSAQTTTNSLWLATFGTYRITDHWSVHLDVQLRSTDDVVQLQAFLFRPGINYRFARNHFATLGYAWVPNRYYHILDNELLSEQRIWQQYLWMQPAGHTFVQHRFRFEQRWVPLPNDGEGEIFQAGTLFSTRFRYFVRCVIPLSKPEDTFKRGVFIAPQNEVFLNTSNRDQVNGQVFDQNRLYGAVGYRFSKSFDLESGPLWQYVNRREGVEDLSNKALQVACYWRL